MPSSFWKREWYQKFVNFPANISTHLSTISNSRYPQFQKEQKRHRVQIPSFDCNHCSQTKKTITIRRRRRRITEITKLRYEKRNREGERVWLPVIVKMKMKKKRDSKLFTVDLAWDYFIVEWFWVGCCVGFCSYHSGRAQTSWTFNFIQRLLPYPINLIFRIKKKKKNLLSNLFHGHLLLSSGFFAFLTFIAIMYKKYILFIL